MVGAIVNFAAGPAATACVGSASATTTLDDNLRIARARQSGESARAVVLAYFVISARGLSAARARRCNNGGLRAVTDDNYPSSSTASDIARSSPASAATTSVGAGHGRACSRRARPAAARCRAARGSPTPATTTGITND
jgi:hypothetical protein